MQLTVSARKVAAVLERVSRLREVLAQQVESARERASVLREVSA